MDASVSLPDPGEFHRPLQNGHAAGLVIEDLRPYDPTCNDDRNAVDSGLLDPDLLRSPGVLPLDPADVGEVLAAPGLELGPDLVEAQTRILEEEFRAELYRLDAEGVHAVGDVEGGTASGRCCNLAHEADDDPGLLPGFEALTDTDLERARIGRGNLVPGRQVECPGWCADAGLPEHGDGFDTMPEGEVPHRGVQRDIPVKHGGKSLDHAGRAEVSLQVEQDRDREVAPVITLSVVVRGIEQYAWLTTAEGRVLHRTLGQLLEEANGQS